MLQQEHSQTAMPARVQLFGQFRISGAGEDVSVLGRKARAILAYLVLVPGFTATREHLSALLWSDRGPEQARASLRQCVRELRSLPMAEPAVHATRSAISLDRNALAVDLHELRKAASEHDLVALSRQIEDLRGELLEDFMDLSPAFDEWLMAERPRQQELLVTDILEALEGSGFGDVKNAKAILRSLDRLDPANEAVVRLGMRLDHAEGDSAAMHRRYRALTERLDRDFGVPPSEETREVYQTLVSGQSTERPALPVAGPSPSPAEARPARTGGDDMLPLVMVSPVRTAAADDGLQSLMEFCADDVRTSLTRSRGLRVLAVDNADLAETVSMSQDALGLYLLNWNAHQIGASLRVNIQLVNAASQVIVWSETLRFDSLDENVIDAIVEKATGAVSPAIDRDLDSLLRQSFDGFDEERVVYTRARLLIRRGGPRGNLAAVQEAVRLLEGMVERNAKHMGARLLLVRMYSTDFWQQICGHDVRQFRKLSDGHLEAAAALEPAHPEVRIRKGWSYLRHGETDLSRAEFEAVLDHLPRDADVVDMCGFGMCHLGRYEEADRLLQRAFFLNPFPPSDYHADYAVMLALRGEPERAEEHFVLSGETGLQYLAVRIANGAAIRDGERRIGVARMQFIRDFHDAWQPERDPLIADVLDWFPDTMPLYPADRLEWVVSGLQAMLAPSWPEPS